MTGAGYQWDEADRLFDEALDLPPGERERWLDRRCAGRPALRRQVESLLRADAAATGFLEVEGRLVADLPAVGAEPEAQAVFETLNSQNRYALAFRTVNMKTEAGRRKKIVAFVEMLKRGETIYPQRSK